MIAHSVHRNDTSENIRSADATGETHHTETKPAVALHAAVLNNTSTDANDALSYERDAQTADLQESQELFRLAVESCPSGMVMIEGIDKIILVNSAIERMFGYLRGELIGESIEVLIPPTLRPPSVRRSDDDSHHARSHAPGASRELVGRRKDASEFPIEVALNSIHSGHGLFVLSVIVDISQRRAAEKHLTEMESRYRGLLEAAPDAMVVVNQAGEIVLLNVQAEKQFGYRRDELLGQEVKNIIPEGFAERLIADALRSAEDALAQQIGTGIELSGRRKDGSEFPIEIMLSPLESPTETLVTAAIRNITARKGMERLKDEFVSTVSHELRTPLTSIAGALGLLIANAAGILPESATRLIAIAHANSQRLVRLTNDILDIEKIESGQVAFNLKRLDVQSLVEQAIEANRGYAEGYGVRVRLADTSAAYAVRADPDRLLQVVTNLLSNAIKFSSTDDEVVVAIEPRGKTVCISVRDHGSGIPADFRSHIFEKFAQADATDTRKKGGTGLGLSIVKQLITRLGGNVGFDDAPGGGTIFHVELPSWDHIISQEIDPYGAANIARVLFCDNDLDTAMVLRDRLRQIGCATDFACTIDDALTRATARAYSSIVVDLDLPDSGDCLHLIYRLRKRAQTRAVPIFAVATQPAVGRDDPRSSSLNVADWISKPLDMDHLVKTLTKSIVRDATRRPQILHVDDDADMLNIVEKALGTTTDLVSVRTLDEARRAITLNHFDLVILDVALGSDSGLDLLPDLREGTNAPIPVVILSAYGTQQMCDTQVEAVLNKSAKSINSLLATVHNRLALRGSRALQEALR